jgi:hypothetical protein
MNRWEYRVLVRGFDKNDNYIWTDKDQRSSEERLNAMGLEGWELIEVVTVSRPDASSWAGLTTGLHYIFKRPGQ